MKRIIVFVLIFVLGMGIVGCGNSKSDNTVSKTKVKNTETEDFDEDKEPLELKEDAKYIIVALKNKYIVIDSEEDFAEVKAAYIGGTDGELYAKYYDFKEIGMYNAVNDLHSGITGRDFDVGIIDEEKFSIYDDWEVVWELKQ